MLVVPLIERKRDGGALTPEEWSALVAGYTAGRVPDYQMSALLMAVYFRGLERPELAALTDAMLASGQRLAFDGWATPRIDKHSTGGVGDKVSLVLAPLISACGVAVPMMSGRGLGHTGGTLDKLEAIPGFRTRLSLAETKAQVMKLLCAMIGQTPEIAPADGKLYALRDVTGTVEAIPLIAASIMSKKLAEGLTGLVIDVKRGGGAFLPALEDGLELARTMIALGEDRGSGWQPQGGRGPLGAAAGTGGGGLRGPGDRGGDAGRAAHHRPGHRRHGRRAPPGGRRHRPERRLRHHREAGGQGARGRAHRLRVRERRGRGEARVRGTGARDRSGGPARPPAPAPRLSLGDEGRDPRTHGLQTRSREPGTGG